MSNEKWLQTKFKLSDKLNMTVSHFEMDRVSPRMAEKCMQGYGPCIVKTENFYEMGHMICAGNNSQIYEATPLQIIQAYVQKAYRLETYTYQIASIGKASSTSNAIAISMNIQGVLRERGKVIKMYLLDKDKDERCIEYDVPRFFRIIPYGKFIDRRKA